MVTGCSDGVKTPAQPLTSMLVWSIFVFYAFVLHYFLCTLQS